MSLVTTFDVAIGKRGVWFPVVLVDPDFSRVLDAPIPSEGKEFRYWRIEVTENGITEIIEGRLSIAGSTNASPGDSLVLLPGLYRTWTRVITNSEIVIDQAGILQVL